MRKYGSMFLLESLDNVYFWSLFSEAFGQTLNRKIHFKEMDYDVEYSGKP